jgi:hypothetical protein
MYYVYHTMVEEMVFVRAPFLTVQVLNPTGIVINLTIKMTSPP